MRNSVDYIMVLAVSRKNNQRFGFVRKNCKKNMNKKDSKNNYKDIDHAKAMFRENSEYFSTIKNEFDILPYSESYYNRNKDYFIHKDKAEPFLFVKELTNLGYLKQTGLDYNFVTITEEGHSFLTVINRI
jgi:hypothetical protein